MTAMITFGQLLRHYRVKAGFTQVGLSKETGITHYYITLLERGRRDNPSREVVEQFANVLNLDGRDRRQLFAAAHYTEDTDTPRSVTLAHPLQQAVEQFLLLEPDSVDLPSAIREVVREFVGAAIGRRAGPQEKSLIRGGGLAAIGYFHRRSSADRSSPAARKGKGVSASQAKLVERICELMEIITDSRVAISKRIGLIEELASLAKWKLS